MNESFFFSGASGLILPFNKLSYPPEYQGKSRLCYYASIFNSIEINSSFYKIPQVNTVRKWGNDVPDNFRFTFKLFRDITHSKELAYDPEHIRQFIDTVNHIGNHKGCILVQFPPGLSQDFIAKLEQLLAELTDAVNAGWNIAVEFRNRTWYNADTYDLLQKYNAGIVIQDIPSSSTPLIEQESSFLYLRFHGPQGGYRGSYTDDFLSEYSGYIKEWLGEGKTVYAYFNNTMGDAYNNLVLLNRYVQEG